MVVGMVDPPADPIARRSSPPGVKTRVGAIEESGTLPGPGAFSAPPRTSNAFLIPGATAKSSISSLSRTPVPWATTQDPNGSLTVVVSATAFPCASTAETWVVFAPSRALSTCSGDERARDRRHPRIEVGVAPALPEREEPLLRLDHHVQEGFGFVAFRGRVIALEDVEQADENHAA